MFLAGTTACSETAQHDAPEVVSYFFENRTHQQLQFTRQSPGREDVVGTQEPCITAQWDDWQPDPRVVLSVNGEPVWESQTFPPPESSSVYILIEEDGTASARLVEVFPLRPANVCEGPRAPSAAPGAG